jgi:hypothetical protein
MAVPGWMLVTALCRRHWPSTRSMPGRYLPQAGALDARRDPGSGDHDEREPPAAKDRIVARHDQGGPDESEVANITLGARLADRVAAMGGSWPFIGLFILVVFGWMLLNSHWAGRLAQTWDQYPCVFLNFVLSLTAALQAPILAPAGRDTGRHAPAARTNELAEQAAPFGGLHGRRDNRIKCPL